MKHFEIVRLGDFFNAYEELCQKYGVYLRTSPDGFLEADFFPDNKAITVEFQIKSLCLKTTIEDREEPVNDPR